MGRQWRVAEDLEEVDQSVRRTRWCGLGVAVCGRRDGQSPFWGDQVGKNPTDRGKNGVKRSLVVEADGGPLGVVIEGANVHDAKLLKRTLQAIVVPKPRPTPRKKQHLCLDKGYDNLAGHAAATCRGQGSTNTQATPSSIDVVARER